MKILVLNCGSSSIKYKLFDMDKNFVMAQGGIEKIGLPGSFLKLTAPNGEKVILEEPIPEHTKGIEFIIYQLTKGQYACIDSLKDVDAVGHRVVHGGEKFNQSTLITQEVLDNIIACNDLAPLHNPANLLGINAVSAIAPEMPQVAVFDTAFHQTMPAKAYMFLTNITKNMAFVVMVSTEPAIVMCQNALAISWVSTTMLPKLSRLISVMVVLLQLSRMVSVSILPWV